MNNILVDTSIIIDFLRRSDKENSLFFKLVKQNFSIAVSIVTHAELYAGKSVWQNIQAQEDLEKIFSGVKILSLEEIISKEAGRIKVRYNHDLFDCIIAATALKHKLSIATLNKKDFEDIKGLLLFNNIN